MVAVLHSSKGPLHGILRDSENREVRSRLHGTKSFRTSDSQDEDVNHRKFRRESPAVRPRGLFLRRPYYRALCLWWDIGA
jgi:hypothetical protein